MQELVWVQGKELHVEKGEQKTEFITISRSRGDGTVHIYSLRRISISQIDVWKTFSKKTKVGAQV